MGTVCRRGTGGLSGHGPARQSRAGARFRAGTPKHYCCADTAYKYIFGTAPVSLEPGRFATAVGHDSGLGVIAYNVSDLSATLVRLFAEATAGDASAIRVRAINSDQAIVALRNGSGKLELIGWQLAARDFAVSRAADTASHPIEAHEVALAVIGRRE